MEGGNMSDMMRLQLHRDRAMYERAGMAEHVEKVDAHLAEMDAAAAEAVEGEVGAWDAVSISPAARVRAEEFGLSAEDFKRQRASGKSGFVVADVDRIAESLGITEDGEADNGDD
jgi:hypothetical protein